jgi:hypothetical protein
MIILQKMKKVRAVLCDFIHHVFEHTSLKEIAGAFTGMIIILAFVIPLTNLFEHIYERWSPASSWMEYEEMALTTMDVKKGDVPIFYSIVERKRGFDVRWEDTLFCRQGGNVEKYRTQFWPEDRGSQRVEAGETPNQKARRLLQDGEEGIEFETWSYTREAIHPEAEYCAMSGLAIVTTPKGYEKEARYPRTPWFPVNQ